MDNVQSNGLRKIKMMWELHGNEAFLMALYQNSTLASLGTGMKCFSLFARSNLTSRCFRTRFEIEWNCSG